MQFLIRVDVRFQRKGSVEHGFHSLLSEFAQCLFNAMRMCGCLFQDVAAGHLHETREQVIIFGEIRMTQNMGYHQRVFRQSVVVNQICVAWIAREHDFENA